MKYYNILAQIISTILLFSHKHYINVVFIFILYYNDMVVYVVHPSIMGNMYYTQYNPLLIIYTPLIRMPT